MKFIMRMMQKISLKELPKPVGRWNLDYCDTKLNNKIGLSNEDHCGVCDVNKFNKHKEYDISKMIFYENL